MIQCFFNVFFFQFWTILFRIQNLKQYLGNYFLELCYYIPESSFEYTVIIVQGTLALVRVLHIYHINLTLAFFIFQELERYMFALLFQDLCIIKRNKVAMERKLKIKYDTIFFLFFFILDNIFQNTKSKIVSWKLFFWNFVIVFQKVVSRVLFHIPKLKTKTFQKLLSKIIIKQYIRIIICVQSINDSKKN